MTILDRIGAYLCKKNLHWISPSLLTADYEDGSKELYCPFCDWAPE